MIKATKNLHVVTSEGFIEQKLLGCKQIDARAGREGGVQDHRAHYKTFN